MAKPQMHGLFVDGKRLISNISVEILKEELEIAWGECIPWLTVKFPNGDVIHKTPDAFNQQNKVKFHIAPIEEVK